jgi:hypothetical protein
LAEAARLRGEPAQKQKGWILMPRVWKLASVLAAAVLLFGMVFGAGHAAAASLPGQPLYGLKLAGEWVLLTLTVDPEAKMDLNLLLVDERLDEVEELLVRGQAPDDATIAQVMEQIQAAKNSEDATWEDMQQLYNAIQIQKRDILDKLETLEEDDSIGTVRNLVRKMERESWEMETTPGQGAQQRHGAPSGADDPRFPIELPDPAIQPGFGPFPIDQPGVGVVPDAVVPPEAPPGGPAMGDEGWPGAPPDEGAPPSTAPGFGPGPATDADEDGTVESPGYGPGAPPVQDDEEPAPQPPAQQQPPGQQQPPAQDTPPGPGPGGSDSQGMPDSAGWSTAPTGSGESKGN